MPKVVAEKTEQSPVEKWYTTTTPATTFELQNINFSIVFFLITE